MVARDALLPHQLPQVRGDSLGHLACLHEDERGRVLRGELGHAPIDLLPLFVRADGGEQRRRHFDREVELAQVALVDELDVAAHAAEEAPDGVERLLRR